MSYIYKTKYLLLTFLLGIHLITNAQYTLSDEDVIIKNGIISGLTEQGKANVQDASIIIPETLHGQIVTGIIDKHWTPDLPVVTEGIFGNFSIKGVVFPNSIKHIGEDAFLYNQLDILDLSNCTDLSTINDWAFYKHGNSNSIKTINLAGLSKLTNIGKYSFCNTYCEKIILTGCSKLSQINKEAFFHHDFTEIDLSGLSSLRVIGNRAFCGRANNLHSINFTGCTSLSIISKNAFYTDDPNDILKTPDLSPCISLTYIGENAFGVGINPHDNLVLPTPQLNGLTFDSWYNANGEKVSNTITDFETSYIALFKENVISVEGQLINVRDSEETSTKPASLKSTNEASKNQVKFTIRNHSVNPVSITDILTTSGATLSWSNGSITEGGEQEVVITYPDDNYENTVTIEGDNLKGNSTITVTENGTVNTNEELLATSVKNTSKSNNFSIYPNPVTNGVLYIKSDTPFNKVRIFNLTGNKVFETTNTSNGIDVSNLSSGIYFIKTTERTYKFIIK